MHSFRLLLAAAIINCFCGCAQLNKPLALPDEEDPWVIRTDFSDDQRWDNLVALISAPQNDDGQAFVAYVKFVSRADFRDKDPHAIVKALPDNYPAHFCFVVDRECITNPDHRVLVIGFYPADLESFERPPRDTPAHEIKTFRALPSQIQGIENNLSIANMDFEEFADAVDKDGVFRGFRR